MLVSKWGNSLAVRLPAAVVNALSLKEGDEIEIQVTGDRNFEIGKRPDARALLARQRHYRGRLPADFKFDRLEAHECSAVFRYESHPLLAIRRPRQG